MRSQILLLFLLFSINLYASENLQLTLEAGAVWQNRNDAQIPADTGTSFEFDKYNEGPFFHHRVELFYKLNKDHSLRLLYAPFKISVTGTPQENISFDGESFSAGSELDVNYMFNSYRLSYIYKLYSTGSSEFSIGFTGKVRDAEIELVQGTTKAAYDNVGFVPLLYLSYQYNISQNWQLYTDADLAAAPQGRAIDFAFLAKRNLSNHSNFGLGLRSLEGGADNDKVVTFSWLNYAIVQFNLSF